jgi:hypothetical protein
VQSAISGQLSTPVERGGECDDRRQRPPVLPHRRRVWLTEPGTKSWSGLSLVDHLASASASATAIPHEAKRQPVPFQNGP